MDNAIVACVQQRMAIMADHEEFVKEARRFLNQARSKAAELVIFPELVGLMLAPPLISGFKLGFIKRADRGARPTAGAVSRQLGRVSGAAAGMMGGGFRGSLARLLAKNSDLLRDTYVETFGNLAREYGLAIVGGSLYIYDEETDTLRNRAYLFDVDGEVLGYQDKLNLAPEETDLASPGTELNALGARFGRVGLLLGRDALYPELARLLTIHGADLLAGIAASPGAAQADVIGRAMALRAEENQVFSASSFLLGPDYLSKAGDEDYVGQSALFAPISMTSKGDGVLVRAGTNRTEGLIAAELDAAALHNLWQTSGFRPRQEMYLGSLGYLLAEVYEQGLSLEQAVQQNVAPVVDFEPFPELEAAEPDAGADAEVAVGADVEVVDEVEGVFDEEEVPETTPAVDEPEPDSLPASVPEALSLTGGREEEQE
jgi:predicted amidohydrolase